MSFRQATDEKKPVVGFIYSLGIALDNILIVPFSFKAKATISCYNDQSIFHLILHTNFIHEEIEVPVNVATDDNAVAVWEIVCMVLIHVPESPNKGVKCLVCVSQLQRMTFPLSL